MDVTDVLRDRMQTPAGLQRMISVSIAAHVVLAAALIVVARRPPEAARTSRRR